MDINSAVLHVTTSSSPIYTGGACFLRGLYIAKALTGTLTIIGFADVSGTTRNWVFPIGSVGAVIPGSAKIFAAAGLTYTLSSASDADLVIASYEQF